MTENANKQRIRKPINKPDKFIERLNLLNLLPDNLDDFLRKLSVISEKWVTQIQREKAEKIHIDSYEENSTHLNAAGGKLYFEYLITLPDAVKQYLKNESWQFGERKLNILAVERESIEIIISQRKLCNEFQSDFKKWKTERPGDLSDKKLYEDFCWLMKTNPPTQERFDAKKYLLTMPGINATFLFPNINEKLHFHRAIAGLERKGFGGFFTRLAAQGDFLDIAAEGIIDILIQQKLNGDAPLELDRLRHCEFCNALIYAYKRNQLFCSSKCYAANYQQNQRNSKLEILKKQLKKANARLGNLQSRLDSNSGLIKDQARRVEEINIQIEAEKLNGTL